MISDGEKDGNRVVEIGIKEKVEVKETVLKSFNNLIILKNFSSTL